MKKITACCLLIILFFKVYSQNWTWAEHGGGNLPDEANGCAMDLSGNMFICGFFFSPSVNFGQGISLSNSGISDGFLVKYNMIGITQWASRMKGSGEDKATKCITDRWGNVFITGYFNSPSLQFGGNNAHAISNFDGSGNTFDCFIAKYNSSGIPQWFKAIGKSDDDGGRGLSTDSSGNVYLTGWFRAPSITIGSVTLYNENLSGGTSDMFLAKYDSNGNVLWAKSIGSMDDEKGNSCVVDAEENVIVTGYCKGDSLNVEGVYHPLSGGKDALLLKYNNSGNLLFTKIFGGLANEEPFSCSVDSLKNIYVTGNFTDNILTIDTAAVSNVGSSDVFLAKFSPSLQAIWIRGAGSSSSDEARSCATDKYGNTVITGVFNGTSISFENTLLNNNGGDEIFFAKYNANGDLYWAKKAGKSKDDGANDCAISNEGKILITGYYNSSSLTLGNFNMNNSYVGIATSDFFVGTTCNVLSRTDTVSACGAYTWMDGNSYTESNNTSVYFVPGDTTGTCDSMLILNLTIQNIDTGIIFSAGVLTANAQNATYRWLDCNSNYTPVPNQENINFEPTINGSYAVEITKGNCVDTSNCFSVMVLNLNDIMPVAAVSLYPNPAQNIINFSFPDSDNRDITITNCFGQIVERFQNINSLNSIIQFKLNPGIYFVNVYSEYAGNKIFKIILQ